jgi:hypothetical protein
VFDSILGERSNQRERTREDVVPDDAAINVAATTGTITEQGIRNNIEVGTATSTPGSAATEQPPSTTSWRTPPPWRSPAPSLAARG